MLAHPVADTAQSHQRGRHAAFPRPFMVRSLPKSYPMGGSVLPANLTDWRRFAAECFRPRAGVLHG